eukprot:393132_1
MIRTTTNEIFGAFVNTIGYEQHWKTILSDHKAFVFALRLQISAESSAYDAEKIAFDDSVLSVAPTQHSFSIANEKSNLICVDEGLRSGCYRNQQFDIAHLEVWTVEDDFGFKIATSQRKESIH